MVRDERMMIEQVAPEFRVRGVTGGGEICRRAHAG
jgi:hypothetical protein